MASLAASPPMDVSGLCAARPKLTGRAFYESIGSPKVVLAPMVDQSEFAWRVLTRSFMKSQAKDLLAYSPMFHARLFSQSQHVREKHFQPVRQRPVKGSLEAPPGTRDQTYLDGRLDVDRPLTVQFCANDPEELLEAAKHVQGYCDAVDLNLGCPQRIAKTGKYGAYLQEDWALIYKLINKLHNELDVPVTAKIRILETKEKTLEYAKTVLAAGASILTVHGRRREQKGHYTGLADWSVIRFLRDSLPPETVLFANGNILRHDDIERCLRETGADAVMSAEGNLHDPSILAPPPPSSSTDPSYWRSPKTGRGGYRADFMFRRYLSIIYEYVLEQPEPARSPLFVPSDKEHEEPAIINPHEQGDADQPRKKRKRDKNQTAQSPSLSSMQAHLFSLLRPLITANTNVRDALAKARSGDMTAFEYVLALTEQAVRKGIREYQDRPDDFEDLEQEPESGSGSEVNITDFESSLRAVKACKRPWWVCQSYVRPLPQEAIEKGSISLSERQKRDMEEENARKDRSTTIFALKTGDPIAKSVAGTESFDTTATLTTGSQQSSDQLPAPASVCG